jgi:hypothetical protein
MTSITRHRRGSLALAAALVLAAASVTPVAAAVPDNDGIGSPRLVSELPYIDGPYDTTEATTGLTDPGFCHDPSAGPDRATVWYSFTPVDAGTYIADTFNSDYDTTLYVGTPDGSGGIDVIDCIDDSVGLQSAVVWPASAGATYLIMVGTCCGPGIGGGGSLELHVDVAPPSPAIELTIAQRNSFTRSGLAIISGTIACENAQFGAIEVQLEQRVGRVLLLRGSGEAFVEPCTSDPTPWSITVGSEDGKFAGGRAALEVFAFACGPIECADTSISTTVQLRR